ncbi:hypothetical protein [Kocuria sabuli]|uniref:hypothetical protein n=1 Tax=Kocuria sabuli TaxID=3071448 RepID=UPI0034D49C38
MYKIKNLQWPLVLGLGALALVRPLMSIIEHQLGATGPASVPIISTVVISIIWVAVVGLSRVALPVLTLLFTGLTYAVLSIILSGILSPILTGELQGPLAMPIAIIPVLAVNAVWGLVAGWLALLVQRARGVRRPADHSSA